MKRRTLYRSFLTAALIMLYVTHLFRVYLPYINYKVNYRYISSVLCVNKNKPQATCNGKCYLKKELEKATEKESQEQAHSTRIVQEEVPSEYISVSFSLVLFTRNVYNIFNADHNASVFLESFTPPPENA